MINCFHVIAFNLAATARNVTIGADAAVATGWLPTLPTLPRDTLHVLASCLSAEALVGQCRLTESKPVLKAPMVTALETLMS
jgi:hypothetical protein